MPQPDSGLGGGDAPAARADDKDVAVEFHELPSVVRASARTGAGAIRSESWREPIWAGLSVIWRRATR
ncbi:hypothetical protein Pme01_32060 [Planosporangium mesophilum]|uniref:Uncharacterized protein n=1 Tax=Planosporangium mesophilum TaxID=689768 RepID=A0A8J3TF39_9ACTN|nr:hypothetical protein Pme01_32060 [Planosporangium mesophilum]